MPTNAEPMPPSGRLPALSWPRAANSDLDREGTRRPVDLRVLLVEDDERFAFVVREMLAAAAPEVELEHASGLSAALARVVGHNFAVIVTDLNLPDSDGLSTVRHLVQAAPEVPVVVLSGNRAGGIALDAIRDGADDFMGKGEIDADALAHAVRRAAERRQNRGGASCLTR